MKINYKFQIQVTLPGLTFNLETFTNIEVSTFEKFGDEPAIQNFTEDALNLYQAYFNLPFDKLAKDLEYIDLNFLLFIQSIQRSHLPDGCIDGNFIPVIKITGEGFEFVFHVCEV